MNKIKKFSKEVVNSWKSNFMLEDNSGPEIDYKSEYNKIIQQYNKQHNSIAIQLNNIYLKYPKGKIGLDDFSLKINKGDFHVLLGNNGAGKSTLMNVVSGMNRNYKGEVLIFGQNVKKHLKNKNGIVYISEADEFPLNISAKKYLILIAKLVSENDKAIEESIKKGITYFNLKEYEDKNPNSFSTGQKKALSLIRALIEKPSILILDEPLANLDSDSKVKVLAMLKAINEDGTTILLSTHILSEVVDFGNAATIIEDGKNIYTGKIKSTQFKEIHKNKFQNFR